MALRQRIVLPLNALGESVRQPYGRQPVTTTRAKRPVGGIRRPILPVTPRRLPARIPFDPEGEFRSPYSPLRTSVTPPPSVRPVVKKPAPVSMWRPPRVTPVNLPINYGDSPVVSPSIRPPITPPSIIRRPTPPVIPPAPTTLKPSVAPSISPASLWQPRPTPKLTYALPPSVSSPAKRPTPTFSPPVNLPLNYGDPIPARQLAPKIKIKAVQPQRQLQSTSDPINYGDTPRPKAVEPFDPEGEFRNPYLPSPLPVLPLDPLGESMPSKTYDTESEFPMADTQQTEVAEPFDPEGELVSLQAR